MLKFSSLGHKRAKKSDTRLTLMVFQKIHLVYRDINNKEEIISDTLLTSML